MGGMCSSPPEPPPNPTHVDLSHFTLLKVVGKGGFGKVNAIQRRSNQELMALKRMSKAEVIKKESHIRMIWTERDIMSRLNSPFLVNLVHAFQDDKETYFVMPFMQGGDLRFHLSKLGCLSEEDGRFYAAEIILGLESMHSLNIIYRDLKPDNALLSEDGHLRLSDFGLSVELKEKNGFKIRGNAGTSGYLSPEVCTGEPYGLSSDVWSLGITIYELIHGRRPFKQWKPTDTVDPVSTMRFGSGVSAACQDLIRGLLVINPAKRLGCGKGGWAEVRAHPWFASLDWDAIRSRSGRAPIQPDREAANCSNAADLADQLMDKEPESIPVESQKLFAGFDWNTDYREYLAKQVRDNNLAGLNLSTATDLGSGANSNASHMIDEQTAGAAAGAGAGAADDNAPKHVHVAGSATLMPPGAAGAATVAANKAQHKEHKSPSDAHTATVTPSSSASSSAVAPAPGADTTPTAAATAAAASSAAKYEVPPSAAASSSSSSSSAAAAPSALPPLGASSSSSSSAVPAVILPLSSAVVAGSTTPLKQPLSSRRASARSGTLNEIPFTRHKLDASLSPRGEAAAAAAAAQQ